MKRYMPQRPLGEADLSVAKSRLRVAAIQAGPSAAVRRHPWSAVIGMTATSFAVTAVIKLMAGRSSTSDTDDRTDASDARKRTAKRSEPSLIGTLLRSLLHLGLPILQSQLTRHFVSKAHEEQQHSSAEAPGAREPTDAVG